MSEAGKIDLILKELYEYHSGEPCSLNKIILHARIDIRSPQNMITKANRLKKDKLIQIIAMEEDLLIKLTHQGHSFCEKSSYAYPGFPIITHKHK